MMHLPLGILHRFREVCPVPTHHFSFSSLCSPMGQSTSSTWRTSYMMAFHSTNSSWWPILCWFVPTLFPTSRADSATVAFPHYPITTTVLYSSTPPNLTGWWPFLATHCRSATPMTIPHWIPTLAFPKALFRLAPHQNPKHNPVVGIHPHACSCISLCSDLPAANMFICTHIEHDHNYDLFLT